MRLPDTKETLQVRVMLRVIDESGKIKKGAKSVTFSVLETDPVTLGDFIKEKIGVTKSPNQ